MYFWTEHLLKYQIEGSNSVQVEHFPSGLTCREPEQQQMKKRSKSRPSGPLEPLDQPDPVQEFYR